MLYFGQKESNDDWEGDVISDSEESSDQYGAMDESDDGSDGSSDSDND